MSVDGVHWRGLSDVALFVDLCARGPAVVVDDVMSYFRVHTQSNQRPGVQSRMVLCCCGLETRSRLRHRRRLLSPDEIAAGYGNLIKLLTDQQVFVPALRDQFAEVLQRIRSDVETADLKADPAGSCFPCCRRKQCAKR